MTLTYIFIFGLIATIATRYYLASRQIRHVASHRQSVPISFAQKVSLADHQKAADYTIAKLKVGLLEVALSAMILIGFTLLGGLQLLQELTLSYVEPGIGQQMLLLVSMSLITSLIDLPFSLYRQFVIEARFNFNRMTLSLFLVDMIKGLALGALIGLPLLWIILKLMNEAGAYWWVWAWLVWTGFNVLMLWLFPSFIAPLFNRFKPLEEPHLKERIENLLTRCGFASGGIFVMDGSKRSSHGNAYFTGMGKAKRIVFYDTLIERLSPAEIEAVLAHELGHFKRQHIRKRLILSFGLSLGALALLGWLSTKAWFYLGLGVQPDLSGYNAGLALALFSLIAPVFGFFLTPLNSLGSRKHEYEADAYAAEQTQASDLISALVKLYQDNAATLTPDPLYSSFYDSHPPAPLRISHLERLAIV